MMTTIKDVAQRAGVSVATVSRVMNGSNKVSESTKLRVLEVIEELSYRPNLLGRNLRKAETRKLLIMLPSISNQFYSKIVRGMEARALLDRFNIMVCITNSNPETERSYISLLTTRLADGIIFLSNEMDDDAISQIAAAYPIVQCCECTGAKTSKVSIDNRQAAYDAVSHLISLGHRRIAMVSTEKKHPSTVDREAGFRQAMEEHCLAVEDRLLQYGTYSFQTGIRACDALLALDSPPSAVFTIADSIAVGMVKQLLTKGLRPGPDMAVYGFDDTSIASLYTPSITTVAQPRYELGYTAMDLLLHKIKEIDSPNQTVVLPHKLVLRESTRSGETGGPSGGRSGQEESI